MKNWELVAHEIKQVILVYSGEYCSSLEVGRHIRKRWMTLYAKKRKAGEAVRNSFALKLESWTNDAGALHLFAKSGEYAEYYGTCLDDDFRREFPQKDWSDDWFTALCFGALPETTDGYFCLGQRGMDEIQSPGKFDMPMGHPRRLLPVNEMVNNKVAFELGINPFSVEEYHPLALVKERGGYNLIYSAQLNLSSGEIEKANPPGAHKARFFLRADAEHLEKFLRQVQLGRIQASPPVVPALILRGGELFGKDWQEELFWAFETACSDLA